MEDHVATFLNYGALVLVQGPDPKLAKARAGSFYTASTGTTSLSASGDKLKQFLVFTQPLTTSTSLTGASAGVLLPTLAEGLSLALAPALLAKPFIKASGRADLSKWTQDQLLPLTQCVLLLGGAFQGACVLWLHCMQ